MKNILVWIIIIIGIIRIIPLVVEELKKNKLLKKKKKQVKIFKQKQKELPEYKILTKIQLWGTLIIPIGTLLLLDLYDFAGALGAASGLYCLLLLSTSTAKINLPVEDLFSANLAALNLSYDSDKNMYYGTSSFGTSIYFSFKILEGKTTFRGGRVMRISPSFAIYYYYLQIPSNDTDLIEVCKDTKFLNKILAENKKDFLDRAVIQFDSKYLIIATQAKAYDALDDAAFRNELFLQAYENAEELVQLILKEAENK